MPTRPGHTCVPGCAAIVPHGQRRCPRHTVVERQTKERDRGSRHERGYGTPWDRLRASWFATEWPGLGRTPVLCGDRMDGPNPAHSLCLQRGLIAVRGRVLDHIVRREDGGPDEPANFQTLCDRCHNVKRQQEGTGARR